MSRHHDEEDELALNSILVDPHPNADLQAASNPNVDPSLAHGGPSSALNGPPVLKKAAVTRISTACAGCRTRKYRCNGEMPCANCVRSKVACVYTPNKRSRRTKPEPKTPIFALPATHTLPNLPVPAIHYDESAAALNAGDLFDSIRVDPRIIADPVDSQAPSYREPLSVDDVYALPDRNTGDQLNHFYLELGWPAVPFLFLPAHAATYETVYAIEGSSDALASALINACFAIATRLAQGLPGGSIVDEGVLEAAESYYTRARQLINQVGVDVADLRIVQALLLLTQYSQAALEPMRAWNTLGAAVRMAMALGLHADGEAKGTDDLTLVEQRRRAWWACWLLDIELSMKSGREGLIRGLKASTPKPVLVEDAYVSAQGVGAQPFEQTPRIAAFIATLDLYETLATALAQEASTSLTTPFVSRLQVMTALDNDLDQWHAHLTDALSNHPVSKYGAVLERQRLALQTRYYNVRVLIFRAALINPALHFSNETFGYQMARLAATTALESAFQQIGIYVKLAEEQAGHSWWHELFHLYVACSALLAGRWTGIGMVDFEETWQSAMNVVEQAGQHSAAQALNTVLQRADGRGKFTSEMLADFKLAIGADWSAMDANLFTQLQTA